MTHSTQFNERALIIPVKRGIIALGYIKALSVLERSIAKCQKKRRDSKNRILQTGERQRKDGRYLYKYVDAFGKSQSLYAWRLVPTDKTPAGKREDLSLREKKAILKKNLADGIDTAGGKMTVCELYQKQITLKGNVRPGTKNQRKYLMDILQEDPIGCRPIDSVKMSDAKEWALRMQANGYAYNTIKNHKRSLNAAFFTALQDDCIRKNFFNSFAVIKCIKSIMTISLYFWEQVCGFPSFAGLQNPTWISAGG